MWSIICITGAASHTDDPVTRTNRASFTEYRKYIDTPYLLYSLTFQLLDILIWFKKYADENPDIHKNKALWKRTRLATEAGWIRGEIIRIADNGYGTFQPIDGSKKISILPNMVIEFKLQPNQSIEITTKLDSTGKRTFIENIRVL